MSFMCSSGVRDVRKDSYIFAVSLPAFEIEQSGDGASPAGGIYDDIRALRSGVLFPHRARVFIEYYHIGIWIGDKSSSALYDDNPCAHGISCHN
jgi:hypothetical protein